MRALKFIVDGQIIRKDLACDFSGIVRGSKGYLQAEFSFGPEWENLFKVAEFRKWISDKPIRVPIIGNTCNVPDEVTSGQGWKVNIVGKRGDVRMTTDDVGVAQI